MAIENQPGNSLQGCETGCVRRSIALSFIKKAVLVLHSALFLSCASANYAVLKQHLAKKPSVIVVYQPLRGTLDDASLKLERKGAFSRVATDVAEVVRKETGLTVSVAYCRQRMGDHCEYSDIAIENPELNLPLRPPTNGAMLLLYLYVRGDYRHRSTEGFPPECTLAMNADLAPADIESNKIGGIYSRNNFYSETHKGSECLEGNEGLMKLIPHVQLLPEARERLSAETRRILAQAGSAPNIQEHMHMGYDDKQIRELTNRSKQ